MTFSSKTDFFGRTSGVGFLVTMLLLFCAVPSVATGGSFIDPRDNKKYHTVKIDTQTWMAENLNYAATGSVCYANDSTNCVKYGRLYNWDTAAAACPAGWHLPSENEWEILVQNTGYNAAGKNLKDSPPSWNGTNKFGFSALPGGRRDASGSFDSVGTVGRWWTATKNGNFARNRNMNSKYESAHWSNDTKALGLSVRCVQDTSSFFIDPRDNKKYRTVKIGIQIWMAENLNYAAASSVCYKNDSTYCNTYGRLYNWATAMTACPTGWHLPSDAEWTALTDFVGGDSTAGTKLKSKEGWNGTDDFDFSALPGGSRVTVSNFYGVGAYGIWWTATESESNAFSRYMNLNGEDVLKYSNTKALGLSVRCLKDL
ncbi:MAG: fibrobacter succinogenes major paralogous domain-containing protein [Fibromonadaceae bacterium]|nr:fibrobacter succinogenes major paralogous domain-containing protein [Fibromonadaceae bacterium]